MIKKARKIVAVSGGFDPIHVGHIRMFEEAKRMGDQLVVIVNNDNWLMKKKGYVFMSEKERVAVIEAFRAVDHVVVTGHKKNTEDMSVCAELLTVRPHIFANGGDRTKKNVPEDEVCAKIGCEMRFGVGKGGKIQSSSWLVRKSTKNGKKNEAKK